MGIEHRGQVSSWLGSLVMVTDLRMPCYKRGIRFGRSDMIKRFLASERTGFYFSALQERGKSGLVTRSS